MPRKKTEALATTTDRHAVEPAEIYRAALETGSLLGVEQLLAASLGEIELVRREIVAEIRRDGVSLRQPVAVVNGKVIRKLEAHPNLVHLEKLSNALGISCSEANLTRKSRGESAKQMSDTRLNQERLRRLTSHSAAMNAPGSTLPQLPPPKRPIAAAPPAVVEVETVADAVVVEADTVKVG